MKRRLAVWIVSDQAHALIVGVPRRFYMRMYDLYTDLMEWADRVMEMSDD